MEIIKGGITSAKGFEAASTSIGLKKTGKDDMAMIYSKEPCKAAGTFTTNVAKAAPVIWDKTIVEKGEAVHAVIVNSGIANACTGQEGLGYCDDTASEGAAALGISKNQILLCSTGVIGKQLPIKKICAGVQVLSGKLSSDEETGNLAANAIRTTDTHSKEIAVTFQSGGKTVTIGGMAKGSGMIHPDMCTMLAFIATDCNISQEALTKAMKEDVVDTYNMISVDGDTSTNDTALLLANGQAGNPEITVDSPDFQEFSKALNTVNKFLAQQIAGDGEGATCLFEVKAQGCSSKEQARTLAKSIACSNLVKTAMAGHDANWGRIICAMGYSGAQFDPEKVDLTFQSKDGEISIAENGVALDFDEDKATEILSAEKITCIVDVKEGEEEAVAWGCDLTHDYITINGDYRS